ncbi:MAG: hypothetical protein N2V75_00955 [Methanophagales archaeon]|nr:hypothetical protein [Methanophagales archaeon]
MEKFKVVVEGIALEEIASNLRRLLRNHAIDVQVKPSAVGFDGLSLEPASIIVAGASVLSALITGLFTCLATRKSGTIILVVKGGRMIEIPKNTLREDIEYYVRLAKELDIDHVLIHSIE